MIPNFDAKLETSHLYQKTIDDFKAAMNECWDVKLLINYLINNCMADGMKCFLKATNQSCPMIIERYLLLTFYDDNFHITSDNICEHQLIVTIYKFIVKNGYLPKFENIV